LGVRGPKSKIEERFCHGELMAKKWLDSNEKQKEEAMFVTDRRTDRRSQRQKIIDS